MAPGRQFLSKLEIAELTGSNPRDPRGKQLTALEDFVAGCILNIPDQQGTNGPGRYHGENTLWNSQQSITFPAARVATISARQAQFTKINSRGTDWLGLGAHPIRSAHLFSDMSLEQAV